MSDLQREFGQIDIYLFDQILRQRFVPGMRVLDAGCGSGRNLVHFLRTGYDVFGVDADSQAIAAVRRLARQLAPQLPPEHFRVEPIEQMTFPEAFADAIVSTAVLHFARDDQQFTSMLDGMWRALKPGGILFCRLASVIGMEHQLRHVNGRRFELPGGVEWYLVDQPMLLALTSELHAELLDPLKTTIVQDQRCMTTWVVRKIG